MRLFANANYDFIGKRRISYAVVAVFLCFFIAAALFFQFTRGGWLAYGVDFTGGTLVQIRFSEPPSVNDLRDALPGTEITNFGSASEFLIRVPEFEEAGVSAADRVEGALAQRFGDGNFEVVRTEAVGARVGGELQRRALLAILFSFAATLIYLAFRFKNWRFGLAAVVATAHDVVFAVGTTSALQLEVSLPMVAAVLTILGYSLNDTIVVFDRVRENLKRTGRREDLASILNRSINETLPRTILTSVTTLAAVLALFIFGGENIRGFSLIMMIGIIVGTFSSIYIASPVLLEIEKRWPEKGKTARPGLTARAGAAV
ncbi:MAG TPA: protein translocase subunit SecF [Longimicrobiales bacterium]